MISHRTSAGLGWLLGRNEKLRQRTSTAALASAMMLCCAVFMYLLVADTNIPRWVVQTWAVVAVGGLLAATLAIRTGLTARLQDPSLTAFQMQWALTSSGVAYVISGPMRALVLPVLVIILMFGVFGSSRRHMIQLMLYSIALYGAAVLLSAQMQTPRPENNELLAHMAIVLLSAVAGTMVCLQVQSMRARLRQKNEDLYVALAQIRELATRDQLTGLLNRRAMQDLMNLERRRSVRSGRPMLLAQLDIDHFKPINDAHGHATGDRALQAFAGTLQDTVRDTDVLARWGGEEFVLMLSDTPLEDARELLERIRRSVAEMAIPHATGTLHMTVSAGLALHLPGDTVEHTLERADQALYTAKALGRNRVAVASPAHRPAAGHGEPRGTSEWA